MALRTAVTFLNENVMLFHHGDTCTDGETMLVVYVNGASGPLCGDPGSNVENNAKSTVLK